MTSASPAVAGSSGGQCSARYSSTSSPHAPDAPPIDWRASSKVRRPTAPALWVSPVAVARRTPSMPATAISRPTWWSRPHGCPARRAVCRAPTPRRRYGGPARGPEGVGGVGVGQLTALSGALTGVLGARGRLCGSCLRLAEELSDLTVAIQVGVLDVGLQPDGTDRDRCGARGRAQPRLKAPVGRRGRTALSRVRRRSPRRRPPGRAPSR